MENETVRPRPSIAVVGAGYVGLVTAVGLSRLGHAIELVETDPARLTSLRRGLVPFSEPGLAEALEEALRADRLIVHPHVSGTTSPIVLLCVGTPIDDDGHADMSAVEIVLSDLAGRPEPPIIVVRSTMPVGTSRRLLREGRVPDPTRFFAVPEFLRQGSALADFASPTRVIIGREPGTDPDAERFVTEVFGAFDAPTRAVSLAEAEIIKNGSNAFLALKISFANELAGLAERSGADIGPIIEGIGLDPRIGASYMRPSLGFGGSCLPKELRTIATSGMALGLDMHVTAAATDANDAQQRLFAERLDALVGGVAGRTIALFGLAFKPDTDDIRSSPAVALAGWLLDRGARVVAHDPAANARASASLPNLVVVDDPLAALTDADVVVIATEWPAFRELDWADAARRMHHPVVLDGRRLLDAERMRALGFRYERVGSPTAGTTVAVP